MQIGLFLATKKQVYGVSVNYTRFIKDDDGIFVIFRFPLLLSPINIVMLFLAWEIFTFALD